MTKEQRAEYMRRWREAHPERAKAANQRASRKYRQSRKLRQEPTRDAPGTPETRDLLTQRGGIKGVSNPRLSRRRTYIPGGYDNIEMEHSTWRPVLVGHGNPELFNLLGSWGYTREEREADNGMEGQGIALEQRRRRAAKRKAITGAQKRDAA